LTCHSVAVGLTLVQTKQIRIHKRNNTNTVQTTQNAVNTSTHITKTPTHYKTHNYTQPHITKPTITHTHTLPIKLKQPQYKIHPNDIVTV